MNVGSLISAIALALMMPPVGLAQSIFPVPTTRVEIVQEGRQLRLTDAGQTLSIDANAIDVDVLDALNCDRLELVNRQTLSGQRFVQGTAAVQPDTGTVAIGLLLQDCVETQVSAVIVLEPEDGSYSIQTLQVPGRRPLRDNQTTYALNSITALDFLQADLLVKHADASGSEALLVFSAEDPERLQFAGCVYTRLGEGDRLCPRQLRTN